MKRNFARLYAASARLSSVAVRHCQPCHKPIVERNWENEAAESLTISPANHESNHVTMQAPMSNSGYFIWGSSRH
jgi:hypothetical protein